MAAMKIFFVLFLFTVLASAADFAQDDSSVKMDVLPWIGELGKQSRTICSSAPDSVQIMWMFKGKPLEQNNRINLTVIEGILIPGVEWGSFSASVLRISNTTADDAGNYTCVATLGNATASRIINLDLSFRAKLNNLSDSSDSQEEYSLEDSLEASLEDSLEASLEAPMEISLEEY